VAVLLLASTMASCWSTACRAGQERPPICSELLSAIAQEARYCGFFCDQDRMRLLQQSYERACLKLMIPPAPFDIDSASINAVPVAQQEDAKTHAGPAAAIAATPR
jgi:hypothetical protein